MEMPTAALSLASLATDVHCHLLPGVDDGSRTMSESLAMARVLAALGVERVHVTPHQFRFELDWTRAALDSAVAALRREVAREGLTLTLIASAEHYYGERLLGALTDGAGLHTFGLEAGGAAILVELPLREPVVGVEGVGRTLTRRGILPVMAHPERVESLADDAERADGLVQAGWRFQLDLLSLAGTYGRSAERAAWRWLERGQYACVGSDLHRSTQLSALERAHALLRDHLTASSAAAGGTPS